MSDDCSVEYYKCNSVNAGQSLEDNEEDEAMVLKADMEEEIQNRQEEEMEVDPLNHAGSYIE
eukprot:14597398-Ditylum_brightwellii.AAC.1